MRYFILLQAILLLVRPAAGQADTAWVREQLGGIVWQKAYSGVLAEYHKVSITLATDRQLVAGLLLHEGDAEIHRLIGDWTDSRHFLLQERDVHDRLTGYLRGEAGEDHLDMEWLSADLKRSFRVRAVPDQLIRIGGFTPVAEWIEVNAKPAFSISVQKMELGMIAGLLIEEDRIMRFEGRCQDGQCSIWSASVTDENGRLGKLSMRQRSSSSYVVTYDGVDYAGAITYAMPLRLEAFCNRAGFLDLIYPDLSGKAFTAWIDRLKAGFWPQQVEQLRSIEREDTGMRLTHRSSGWIEILEANENMVSGLMTLTLPGQTRRTAFVWLRREDELLTDDAWLNLPVQRKDISLLALNARHALAEDAYGRWVQESGYAHTLPVRYGLVASTDFHLLFGDALCALPAAAVRLYVKKKYWRYFNWPDR